jgi:CubicO group peptidase (beta-lactamase class C family)
MLNSGTRRRIVEKLRGLVQDRAAPGFQLALGYKNETIGLFSVGACDLKNRRPVRSLTWFDLASLTKVLVTVDLLMRAKQENRIIDLSLPLRTWFPFFSSDLRNQSIFDLLNHRAALPAIFEYTHELGEDLPSREDRVRFFLRKIDETYLPHTSPERKVLYSDVGFILLGVLLEQIYGKRLRLIYQNRLELLYGPLSFSGEWISWLTRGPNLAAIQSLEAKPRWLKGVVQDPRAQWLDGDAGHAGLFGTAFGVENWARELFLAYHGKSLELSDKVVRHFIDFEHQSGPYLNGFDTPSKEGVSQSGSRFGSGVVGHLGYTGCSFWMDIERGIRVTLLSHRFQPGFESETLKKLRPAFHDWLVTEVFAKIKN